MDADVKNVGIPAFPLRETSPFRPGLGA